MSLPAPYYEADGVTIYQADCRDVLARMDRASVDAVVTDPPYALGFMGKEWDRIGDTGRGARARIERAAQVTPAGRGHDTSAGPYLAGGVDSLRSAGQPFQQWCQAWGAECLRVLKPGGHLAAFGGTRTYHRLTCGLEDAGFEIRDCLAWLYGSGFPKSLDVSKAIDKAARGVPQGTEDPTSPNHGRYRTQATEGARGAGDRGQGYGAGPGQFMAAPGERADHELVPEAQQWGGWGTALKPAHEPIVLARKPLANTVAGNVLTHGTGALNIDGCRIEANGRPARDVHARRDDVEYGGNALKGGVDGSLQSSKAVGTTDAGRWPANVVLDDEAAAMLDVQSGMLTSGKAAEGGHRRNSDKHRNAYAAFHGQEVEGDVLYGDPGGASRFFYTAKASKADRGEGNTHPTVKPVELMRWLVRLVTPPGGTVIDPFAGSGTTGVACLIEGFHVVLIEREAEYVEIVQRRLSQPIEPVLFGGAA